SVTGLTDPTRIGGDFVINPYHINQNDIQLHTVHRSSKAQLNFPNDFTMNGRINGNSRALNGKLNVSTSDGFIAVNGRFSNLTKPESIAYNGTISTTHLQLGKILRKQNSIGSLTSRISVNGRGLT